MPVSGEKTYAAELTVAAQFTHAGWNTYFPQRDQGFDFVVSKYIDGQHILRPVQVKGKYPEANKSDNDCYGYVGRLSRLHPEMVLAIPYFTVESRRIPEIIAYVPRVELRNHSRGYRTQPASFKDGKPQIRPGFQGFFGVEGLKLLQNTNWAGKTAEEYDWLD